MFALRQEWFCATGVYPLSIEQLLESYQDDNRIMVEYFMNQEKLESDIVVNHKNILMLFHDRVQRFIQID